jgi:hypothetical protein
MESHFVPRRKRRPTKFRPVNPQGTGAMTFPPANLLTLAAPASPGSPTFGLNILAQPWMGFPSSQQAASQPSFQFTFAPDDINAAIDCAFRYRRELIGLGIVALVLIWLSTK